MMPLLPLRKMVFQCDFDGTITNEDVSFILLDSFAGDKWRPILKEYQEHKITVGQFNTKAFAMVKARRKDLLESINGKFKVREGLPELVAYCRSRDFRFVIVSNGLDFYIKKILEDAGLDDVEICAARTRFNRNGLKVQYIGPDGTLLDNDFKEAYVKSFLKDGYQVIYAGNGDSDILPAAYANYVFATGNLLAYSKKTRLNKYLPFESLRDIVRGLESLERN